MNVSGRADAGMATNLGSSVEKTMKAPSDRDPLRNSSTSITWHSRADVMKDPADTVMPLRAIRMMVRYGLPCWGMNSRSGMHMPMEETTIQMRYLPHFLTAASQPAEATMPTSSMAIVPAPSTVVGSMAWPRAAASGPSASTT